MTEPAPDRVLSLANLLTLARLPMAGLVWVAPGSLGWVLGLMAAAALSDVLDGWVARRLGGGQVGGVGAWLDPVCDKVFVVSVLVAVWVVVRPPVWVLPAVAARELIVVPLGLAYRCAPGLRGERRYDLRAVVVGKAATVAQFLTVAALLLDHPAALPLAGATGALGVAAGAVYLRRAWRQLRGDAP